MKTIIRPEQSPHKNKYYNFASYIAEKDKQRNAPARCIGGIPFILWEGRWITYEAFKTVSINPESLLMRSLYKGINCDGKTEKLR